MKIAVLTSGGVDSSVALNLLHRQGYELEAFYLQIWLDDELSFLGECPWEEDLNYVRACCEQLDVPLQIIPLQKQYHQYVIDFVLEELKKGHTPSPDILCNQYIKFGAFLQAIDFAKYDKVASGHYAQIIEKDNFFWLKCTPDKVKDQTYFLATLSQKQLSKILFPIGHLTKQKVRQLACDYSLPNKDRRDSQGVCFLGKIKYSEFVRHHLGEKKGQIVEWETGEKKGNHQGVWFYTIGQRQAIGLHGGPWYVVKKDLTTNTLYISHKDMFLKQSRNQLETFKPHWISKKTAKENLQIKLRHGPATIEAKVTYLDDGLNLKLAQADTGIASGQSVIFYDKDICLGSAVIK